MLIINQLRKTDFGLLINAGWLLEPIIRKKVLKFAELDPVFYLCAMRPFPLNNPPSFPSLLVPCLT
jgi:hypothetical protein